MEQITRVIFRMFKGEVIAIFPELPGTMDVYTCSSYMHIGQHGACDPYGVIGVSKPAKEKEYVGLYQELLSIGYRLLVVAKNRYQYLEARRKNIYGGQ